MSRSPRQPDSEGMRQTEVIRFDRAHPAGQRRRDVVIAEGPLNIQVDGTPYTLLRTPGSDRELGVGFLFTEGLIEGLDDIMLLSECPDAPNAFTVKTSVPKDKPRRTLVITSSCGLCGREDIGALIGSLGRIEGDCRMPLERIYQVPAMVRKMQPLFGSTGGAHASALIRRDGRIECVKEDVGRHNAMDKLIGYSLLQQLSLDDVSVFLSGRTSIEMVIKAGRARIPILLAVGAATDAAVEAADRLGITLCGFLRGEEFSVYTHAWRIAGPEAAGGERPAAEASVGNRAAGLGLPDA